ncbi:MAG: autotransporter domain-containing protein [Akkermansia sp.]
MKLHLPCGLRKALLAVLALLSPLTATPAATTIATATLGAAALALVPQAQAAAEALDLSDREVTYSEGSEPQFSTLTTNADSKIILGVNSTLAQASGYTDAVTLQGTLQLGDVTYGGGATFQTNGNLTIAGTVTRVHGSSHLVAGGSFTLTGRVDGDGSPFDVKAGADVSFSPTGALTTTVQKVTFIGSGDHTFTVGDKANLTLAQGIETEAGATTTITGSGSLCVQGTTSCTVSTLDFGSGALNLETGMTASGSTNSAVKTLTLTGDADLTISSAGLTLGSVVGSAVGSNTVKALNISLYGAASGVNLTTAVDGMIYLGDDSSSASSGSLVTLTDVRLAPSKLVVTGVREVSGTSSIYVTTSTTLGYSTTAGSLTISGGTGHVLGILETASGTEDSLVIGTGVLAMFAAINDEANDRLTIKGNGELKQQINNTTGVTINSALTVESRASLTTNGDLSIAGATGTRLKGKVSVASNKTLTIAGSADVDGATLNAESGKVVLNTSDAVVKATINTDTIELGQDTTLTGRTTAATIDTQSHDLTLDSVAFTNDSLNRLTLGDGSLELKGTTQVTINTLTTTGVGSLTLGGTAELRVGNHDINQLLAAFDQIKLGESSVLNTEGDLDITDDVLNKLIIGADATMKLNGSVSIATTSASADKLLGNIVLTNPDTQDMEITGVANLSGVAAHELYIHEGKAEISLQELTTGNYSEVQLSHGLTMENGSELGITNDTDAIELGSLGEVNLSSSKLTLTGKAGAVDVLKTTDINLSNSDLKIQNLRLSIATSDPEAINVNGDSRLVLIDAALDGYQVLVNSTRTETTMDPAVDLGGEVSFNTLTVLNGGVDLKGTTTGNIALNSAGASLDLEGKLVGKLTLGGGTLNVKADVGADIADGSEMTVQALNAGGTIALAKDITIQSLAGNGTLRVEGADKTLTLATAGTHTGDITLTDGVNLTTGVNNALGSAGTLEVQGNSKLTLAGDEDKNIDITDTLTVAGQERDHMLSGSISGGKLVAEATGLFLTGELSLTQTSISAGRALVLVDNRSASLGAVTNSGTLALASTAATTTTADSLSGTGTVYIGEYDTLEVAGEAFIIGANSGIEGTLNAGSIELSNTELAGGTLEAWNITLGSSITDSGDNNISTGELTVTGNVELTGDALRADETMITDELRLADSTQAELGDVTNSGTLALASTTDTTTTADSVASTGALTIGEHDTLEVAGAAVISGTGSSINGTLSADSMELSNIELGGTLSAKELVLGDDITDNGINRITATDKLTIDSSITLTDDTVDAAATDIAAGKSLTLTSGANMGKLGTTDVDGTLTLEGTGTAPSTLTADIELNGTGSASLTNIELMGSISTTNTNRSDTGSTSLTLASSSISGDLTVVGGSLTLSGANTVGGALFISDTVTVNNDGTGSLTVIDVTEIGDNGHLIVENDLDSAIRFNGNGATATFNGTHTQAENITLVSSGTIKVDGKLTISGAISSAYNTSLTLVGADAADTDTLVLSYSNTGLTADINSYMDTIVVRASQALGSGDIRLMQAQTLSNTGATAPVELGNNIALRGKTLTLDLSRVTGLADDQADVELSGVLSTGSLLKTGTGMALLQNADNDLRKVEVQGGRLALVGGSFGNLKASGDGQLAVAQAALKAQSTITTGEHASISLDQVTGQHLGNVSNEGTLELENRSALEVAGITNSGTLKLDATSSLSATGDVDSTGTLTVDGELTGDKNISISGTGNKISGKVTAEDDLTLANTTLLGAWLDADIIELGENITDDASATRSNAFTASELKVTSEVTLTEDSILADQTTITGTGHLTLTDSHQAELGSVTNEGTLTLASTTATTTTADSVENTGTLSIGATDRLEVTGEVSSTGTTATVTVVGTLTAKNIDITGGNATHLNSISGTVQADEDEGTLSLAYTKLGSGATLDGAGVVLESNVKTADGATGVSLSGDSLEVTGEDNVLTNAKVDFAESSIEADSSLLLTSNTDMGKLGTTTVEGALTLEGTGTAPSTLTADITLNGTGSASLTNIALQGSISTTNTNAADAAEGSTSLTLKDTDISGDLTVVGGTLTLGGNNSVGGAVVISDVVTIVNDVDQPDGSLTVSQGTVIKANGELRVDENNSLDSAIIFDRYGLVEGANPLLTPTDAVDPTATFTGTHTQNRDLEFASNGTINVVGSLELNGHLVKKDLTSQNNPAETVRLYGVTLTINSDNEAFDLNIASAMQRIELGEDEALGAEGTLTLVNDQTLANNTQATTQSKDIDLNGKTLTVETGEKLELAGVVDNGSITKTGDAKLTLSNDSEEAKTLTKLTVSAGSVTLSGEHYTVKDTVLAAGTDLRSEGGNIYGDSTGNTGISGTNAEVLLSMDELDNAKLVLSHDVAPTTGATVTLSGTTGSLAEGSSLTNERAWVLGATLSGQLAINGGVSLLANSHLRDLDLTLAQDGGVGTQETELGNVTLQEGRLSLNGGNSATGKTLTLAGDADDDRSISVLHDVEENLSDATLAVHADGSISTQENASLTLGSITGEAELTKVGVGALTLTADNAASFTGTIVLREGTLAAQTSGAFGGSDAELVIAQNPQMPAATGIGASATPARLLITGTEGGAPVSYDSDLSVEADATLKTLSDTTWTGLAQLSGAANYTLTKEGAAALILDSNSPGFATAIALNEGRLEVNGTIASKVTMTTGTTLNGSGTLGDVTGAADSSIYVGAAAESSDIATLTVGQYRANGAALLLDVTNAGADKLVVTAGAADVSADTLKLHFAGDESAVAEQTRHTILDAQGTDVAVSGDYGLRIEHNMDTRNAHTVNEGGDVILVLSKNHKGADKNGNQQSVSDALRDIERAGIATGELAQVLNALAHTTSEGQALAALDSLGGVNNTALMTSVLEGALDHTRNLRQMAGQNGATRIELKGSDECCRRYHTTPATELWFAPTAGYTRIGGAEGVPSFGRQGYGAMLGVDRSLTPEVLLGLSCGYEYSKINITGAQKSTGDNYYLDLYGRVNKGRWAHSFSVGVGVHELMHKRNVGVAGLAPFAGGTKGDISGMSLNLSYEAAVNFRVSERATMAPVFTIDSTAAWLDSYTETGMGNAGLSVNRQDAWSTVLGLGARYSYEFRALTNRTRKRSVLTAQAMLTLDAADQGSSVKAHFIGAPGYDFTQNGPSRDRVGGLLSVGVDLPVTDSWSGFGGVSYELRNDYRSADGHIGVRYSF